jgi:hypothetical protein
MYCPSTSGVKYFYGYLLKGHYGQKTNVSIVAKNRERPRGEEYDHDELQHFKEMRVMGPYEAWYKVTGTQMAHIYPPVDILAIHLQDEQTLYFEEGQEEEAIERDQTTQLTAWFRLNQMDGPHRGKLYQDVVNNYSWEKNGPDGPYWRLCRAGRHTLGRLPPVSTAAMNSELFHLRLLLCNRTDITSFAHLRTVNGELHPTFKSACEALNLTTNDQEIILAMDELREQDSRHYSAVHLQ